MVNATISTESHPGTPHRMLIPEILGVIDDELLGENERVQYEALVSYRFEPLRSLMLDRGLSETDIEFNLRVSHICDVALLRINLVADIQRRYSCSKIEALCVALDEMKRYKEQASLLLLRASHPQDKEALRSLIYLLDKSAGQRYRGELLDEARTVNAIRTERVVAWGQVLEVEEPNEELIRRRFALDAIWDGQQSMVLGTTECNRRLVKKLVPRLDGHPEVDALRRSLGIPPGGFPDVDDACKWSRQWSPSPSAQVYPYWFDMIRWESFTWDPERQAIIARGYIALHLPGMNETLRWLVRELQLPRSWYDVLPLYLIRGTLEPPPRVKWRKPPMRERDELLTGLVDEHGYDLAQIIYNGRLAPEDVANILERNPRILPGDLYVELHELADERNSWLPEEKRVSYDGLRKIVSRTRARRSARAKHEADVTRDSA